MSESSSAQPKPKGRWLRRILIAVVVLILLAAGAYVALGMMADARMSKEYDVALEAIEVPDNDDARKRGEYLATAVMLCTECHGANMGGKIVIQDGAVGTVAAPNLTSGKGSAVAAYTTEDWLRAIRFGIRKDKHPLVLMPSEDYWAWGDDDLGALLAWIKSLPPVDNQTPPISLGPIGKLLIVQGALPMHAEHLVPKGTERPEIPPAGPTREYGQHLATVCAGCHRQDFSGGIVPGGDPSWPPAANLTPDEANGIGKWTKEQFVAAIRTGKRPDGRVLRDAAMPWPGFSKMTDDDLTALWLFLRSLSPVSKAPSN